MRKRSITAAAVTATTVLATAISGIGSASAAPSPKAIPHSKPAWVAKAKALGAAHSAVNARVYLAPRGGLAALARAANAAATPGSATYHKFLSVAQYNAKYAPTSTSVKAVESFLRSNGLKVTKVGAANRYVAFSGSVSAAQKAFGTTLKSYKHAGRTVQAPAAAVKVPAGLSSTVLTVSGLDTTPHRAAPASTPPAGFRNARPCSVYFGQLQATTKADFTTPLPQFNGQTLPYAPCGYTGPQLRAAYEGNTNLDGSGVTVAITDAYADHTIAHDANHYAIQNGDGSYAPGQFVQNNAETFRKQADCDPAGWSGEETLDVEAVHAMAPGANIRYYGAASCYDNDLTDALAQVVQDDQAQLVTNSWGEAEEGEDQTTIPAFEAVFLQGALQGISFMFSSGDNADELPFTGIKQADYPTSDPYVTSVGGTSTAIGAGGEIDFQTGWGTVKYSLLKAGASDVWANPTLLYGSGGGASHLFNKPGYQAGISTSPYREVPDVAMNADPNTGMLIGQTQTFPDGTYYDQYRIGGTSLASPLFAGLTALTLEHGQTAMGLLNPTIYNNQGDFTDVKGHPPVAGDVRVDFANSVNADDGLLYSVRTFNQDSTLAVKKGYDEVTGVGAGSPAWIRVLSAPTS